MRKNETIRIEETGVRKPSKVEEYRMVYGDDGVSVKTFYTRFFQ